MSKTRSLSALAGSLCVLAAACWLVTMTFPLSAAPQTTTDGFGVTVDLGTSGIMHRTPVTYPMEARRARVEGTVIVEAVVDNIGNVVDARVLSGPTELRRSALTSVLSWHFATDTGANTRQVRITYKMGDEGMPVAKGVSGGVVSGVPGGVPGGVIGGVISNSAALPRTVMTNGVPTTLTNAMPQLAGRTINRILVGGLTDEARKTLLSRLPVREGDVAANDTYERLSRAVREYDEHLNVGMSMDKENGMNFMINAPGASATVTPTLHDVPTANGAKRITIGGNVQQAKLVRQPRPVYPPLAKQARISGVVKLNAIIAVDGTIRDLQVISGHPLLIPAAIEAVKQWQYQQTLLNGDPVEVQTQIDVNFTLSDEPPQQ